MLHRPYFAYGSNICRFQMEKRCPSAYIIGIGYMNDFEFIINQSGVATLLPKPGTRVQGLVWQLTQECERSLDFYEGVRNRTYLKQDLPVLIAKDGTTQDCLIYLASQTSMGKPKSGYLEKIVAACKRESFDDSYLAELGRWFSLY